MLWEQESGGTWQGLTGNYIRAYTAANAALTNRLLPTTHRRLEAEGIGHNRVTETASA